MRKKITLVASLAFAAALCAGFGATNMQAEAQVDWADFKITETAVRLGAGTQEDPTGLRFKVNCPNVDLGETAEYYTMISFTSSVEGEAQEYNLKVPATKWRTDNSGWNAVLLEIPASDYVTEITAQSFVEVDGEVVHTSNSVTSSIAKTASKVLNGGMVDAKLDAFVSTIETEITLNEASATFNQLNTGTELTASLPEAYDGYAVTWKSSNESVAIVDKNGRVTAVGNGSATISANLGNNTATFAATAENMAITFSEEAPVAAVSNIMASASSTAASLATAEVVNLGDNKVYGTANTTVTGRDLYFSMPYSVFSAYFTAYPDCAAVTFDTYSTYAVNQARWYHGITTEGGAGNNNIYLMVGGESAKVNVNGTDYYKTTWTIGRASFEKYTANISLVFRHYGVFGSVLSEFYVDNVGAIVEYQANLDFESGRYSPIAYVGANATTSGYNFESVTVTDAAGNETTSRMFTANASGITTGTISFPVDRGYLDTVFAHESVTHFQFDIIANWSTDTLVLEDNTYTMASLATWADAEAVSVNGTAGFYKLTVRLAREMYEVDGTKDANFVTFRFKWGGTAKSIYFDNFKGVTVHNVLSGSYGTRYTVSANSETGATYTSTSSTYELCFDQDKMVDAFYTQGAKSITFTLEAEGYDIVGFRTWSGELVYCRPIIHLSSSSNTARNGNAEFEIVDGKAVITIDASFFTPYFDENGAYKANSIPDTTSVVGFGMRLSVLWGWGVDADGKQNEVIPNNTVYTMSNFTLNF